MKYKYVVFDFNGTVLDDVELCYDILNYLLTSRGYKKVETINDYRHIFTFPIKKYYIEAGFDFSKHSFESIADEFIEIYQPKSYECKIYPGIIETCKELRKEGYKVILLSASKYENLMDQLQKFNIVDLFDKVLGIDNIHATSKVGIAKEYFKDIDPKEIIFIGDSLHDNEVSKEIGGTSLLVTYGHQAKDVLQKANVPLLDSIYQLKEYLND